VEVSRRRDRAAALCRGSPRCLETDGVSQKGRERERRTKLGQSGLPAFLRADSPVRFQVRSARSRAVETSTASPGVPVFAAPTLATLLAARKGSREAHTLEHAKRGRSWRGFGAQKAGKPRLSTLCRALIRARPFLRAAARDRLRARHHGAQRSGVFQVALPSNPSSLRITRRLVSSNPSSPR
jgi:hypothetical protein